jgi:hypothetical protein
MKCSLSNANLARATVMLAVMMVAIPNVFGQQASQRPQYQESLQKVLSDKAGTPEAPGDLGSTAADLVYTPVTPCRIVDTRVAAAGMITGNTTRTFDVDGTNFSTQGGFSGSCGIPSGVARAVAMTITVTQPVAAGYFTAWALGTQPFISVLNYEAGATIANTTIVPVDPG